MCGIFGILAKNYCSIEADTIKDVLIKTAKYSEERGKDSSGIAFRNEQKYKFDIIKGPVRISRLLKTKQFKNELNIILNINDFDNNKITSNKCIAVIGHARLTTNGTQLKDFNNQPVVKDGMIAIHNGIITNVDKLWESNKDLNRLYDIDTEILLSLFGKYQRIYEDTKYSIIRTIKEIFGTVAVAIFIDNKDEFILTTNNGSLYSLSNNKDLLVFASERYILEKVLKRTKLNKKRSEFRITQLRPNTGIIMDLNKYEIDDFNYDYRPNGYSQSIRDIKFSINVEDIVCDRKQLSAIVDIKSFHINPKANYEKKLLEYNIRAITELRRCKICLLPETFPFIEYDEEGVCNICRNYKPQMKPHSIDQLMELVEPYRRNNEPDCIVPYSGGRDSTFALHLVKKILHMNPLAFTYDWGMVTDLARRNIARVCGKLGVENIIVSADIHWKRENIRKNILAWLKIPTLGMIPLFMAGDKYFSHYTIKLKKQTGIRLNIWGTNPLENTDFKVGFCGIPLRFNKKHIYSLKVGDQFKLFNFVSKNILKNPSYINQSLFDTAGSFATRYFSIKKDMYYLYEYYQWDEKEIENLIIDEYDWETAIDTDATWRIGDGTSAFYNYVYYTVAGFSEIDTFRSNQIREGMMTREKALELSQKENKPRFESIKWYLEIVGLDFEDTIKKINSIKKMY